MREAKTRIGAMLALVLIGLGASISAAFTRPGGWLVLLAYVAGAACAWLLVTALFAYAQLRQAVRLREALNRKRQTAELARFLQQRNAAGATPAVPPINESDEE
ncbi:hypothetical protein I5J35_gp60 [Mycobacterium phage Rem711]|uniref:Uncharacterized protein n=1 Tax=Mycobacterium phage Rem711 TaxID=2079285 RepID=A0A2K9VEY1_9CAUD|nr:hypothetical protein I5J35_gp60 [Mycobacterium phage Rem711]AUV60838.1 hypothetical protein SEA_REM711_60 [Mycobacterium phage Rem711]